MREYCSRIFILFIDPIKQYRLENRDTRTIAIGGYNEFGVWVWQ